MPRDLHKAMAELAAEKKWEVVDTCLVCGSDRWTPAFIGRAKCLLCVCESCDTIFLNPRPRKATSMDSGYNPSHAQKRYLPGLVHDGYLSETYEPDLDKMYRRYQKLVDMVLALEPRNPVIDIGCGIGLSMLALSSKGIDCIGFDVDDSFLGIATDTFGLDVRKVDVFAPDLGQRYDIATLNSVLEHIEDPVGFLRAIRENILAPGGALVITLPNTLSFQFLQQGREWRNITGGHVWYPTEASTAEVAARAGFSVERIHTPPPDHTRDEPNIFFLRHVIGYEGNITGGLGMVLRA